MKTHARRRARSTGTAVAVLAAALALALSLAGCSTLGGDDDRADDRAADRAGDPPAKVVLVTHDSFQLPDELWETFREEHGYEVVVLASGDAGALSAKLALTSDNPSGDAAFGIDNTFASRVLEEGVFAEHDPELPAGAEQYDLPEGADRLTPIDVGDVCVNIDTTWFAERGVRPPATLQDLTEPAYEDLFVVPAASTSSPGMAFLLTTIAAFGDDWQDYWRDLLDNGLKITQGWSDAYYTDFTQGGEGGRRPIVLSYASSPAFTVPEGAEQSTTEALLDTCFRQVEYAGVLEGAANPEGAEALVEFLLTDEVQAAMPEANYVYPVADVELPAEWARHAALPEDPLTVDPAEIADNRETWLQEWTDLTTR